MQGTVKMKLEKQALNDLEIFETTTNAKSIFGLLNKTTTDGGYEKLKKIFNEPKNNIYEINKMQEAIKFILEEFSIKEFKIHEGNIAPVIEYINSNIMPVTYKKSPLVAAEGLIYKIRYPDYYDFFSEGIIKTIVLIKKIHHFYRVNDCEILPELLKNIFKKLKSIFENRHITHLKDLDKEAFSIIETFTLDKLIREELTSEVNALIEIIYELDVYISMAKSIKAYNLCFPQFINSKNPYIKINGAFHLFVSKPVPNNIEFSDENNFMFLTGPNMAGKTTFLKTCGVSIYLAHLGIGVPAENMQLTLFDGILTSINTNDNLSAGHSYYYSEVKKVKDIALTIITGKRFFVIFDELFKGTNVEDAYECSNLVISGLTNWKNSIFILSSHLIELEKELRKYKNISFNYFCSEVEQRVPVFDFKLKKGVSKQRLGKLILENEEIINILNPVP